MFTTLQVLCRHVIFVICLLKARTVKPAEAAVARERFSSSHFMAAIDMYATIEVLLEGCFLNG
jgi:hypothetical protein